MRNGANARRKDERGAHAGEDAKDNQKMPKGRANGQQKHGSNEENVAAQDEQLGPVDVEEGTDQQAAEEGEECVQTKDPADGRLVVLGELVVRQVRLEDADRVHEAEAGHLGGGLVHVHVYFLVVRGELTMPENEPTTTSQLLNPPSG